MHFFLCLHRVKNTIIVTWSQNLTHKKKIVTLYPGSVFIMSLAMNREYTHEIVPSILPIEHLPVRMGYVIRCSKTRAIFLDNKSFIEIEEDATLIPLQKGTKEEINILKELYAKQNLTNEIIEYPFIGFSLNSGDYTKPLL